jgi:hypothetical protein
VAAEGPTPFTKVYATYSYFYNFFLFSSSTYFLYDRY